ncbi:MAG: putative N6-adenine-specific DNA methylase [Paracoccaceae bacterium]|jgi:putative N6-adenine-specific DNA methylase
MNTPQSFEIFLAAPPGLESVLAEEARIKGFADPTPTPGGVTVQGGWPEVWRANLELRGAGKVLARVGGFMAFHLAQLDKRSRKFPWGDILRPDMPVRVEVTCAKSKIYHAGAAAQRIEKAITEELGAAISPEAEICIKTRIIDNNVTFSIDTSGEPLHKRGHKEAVGKAPMRETLASMFLRQCGYDGIEPVVDPMCGSGTFVIEAAEIAAGLAPGRTRSFAFERLASFDPALWAQMRAAGQGHVPAQRFYGADRDAGAVRMSRANAERAGVTAFCDFECHAFADLTPPDGPPGLVMVNPPYGGRIGNKKLLYGLYAGLGEVLATRFKGWRVGMITSEASLAKASGLPFKPMAPPVAHGGTKVWLFHTGRLK